MRMRHKLLVAAAALCSATFIGCSMSEPDSSGAVISLGSPQATPVTETVVTRTLSGVIDNIADYDAAAAGTRVIMPGIDDTTYDYYIYGKTVVGGKPLQTNGDGTPNHAPVKLTEDAHGFKPTAGSQNDLGSFSIKDIAATAWEFTLAAVKNGVGAPTDEVDLKNKAYLISYAYVDLTRASGAVKFHLIPDGLAGTATATVSVYLSDSNSKVAGDQWAVPDGTDVFIGVQNLITGAEVVAFGDAVGIASNSYKKVLADLNPGTYNLVVKFVTTKDTKKIESYWSDILVVLPNRSFNADVFVPNIIGTKPAAPKKLVARYVENSMDNAGREGFYKVHFQWDGTDSVNERYFELQLLEVTGKGLSTDAANTAILDKTKWALTDGNEAKDWTATALGISEADLKKVLRSYTPVEYTPAEENAGGSLVMNNNEITMYLPLGKAYWARIRSVNNFGESKWEYVDLSEADTVALATGDAYFKGGDKLGSAGATAFAESINMTKITYNKNGGANNSNMSDQITYFVVDKSAIKDRAVIPFWAANGDPDNPLVKGTGARADKFVGWTSDGKTENSVYKAVSATATAPAAVGKLAAITGGLSTEAVEYVQTTVSAATDMIATWIGDPNKATTETALETADDGGYRGYGCITLYADYTGSLTGQLQYVDLAYDYRLATDWISVSKGGSGALTNGQGQTPATLYESFQMDWSKSNAAQGETIKMSVTYPVDGAYKIGDEDYKLKYFASGSNPVKITATVKDPYGSIKYVDSITASAFGTKFDFNTTGIDISNWENGSYTIYFAAVYETTGKTITRSVSVTLNITD